MPKWHGTLSCPHCGYEEHQAEEGKDAFLNPPADRGPVECPFCGTSAAVVVSPVFEGDTEAQLEAAGERTRAHRPAIRTLGRFAGRRVVFGNQGLVSE